MATTTTTFPTYPITTFEDAVDATIFESNQLGSIINGDGTTTVTTVNGDVPTVRKALVDNLYFKTPIDWASGTSVTVFNQLYYFAGTTATTGYYYAPTAMTSNPVTMGTTPDGDSNFVVYSSGSQAITELAEDTGAALVGTATGVDLETRLTADEAYINTQLPLRTSIADLANTTATTGAGLVGFSMGNSYAEGTAGFKLEQIIHVEDYADTAAAAGDWTTALQAAIDEACATLRPLRGNGSYAISGPLYINTSAVEIFLNEISVNADWPANTTYWDAESMFQIGNTGGNIVGINLTINTLRGGLTASTGVANGVNAYSYGYSLSHIHIGSAQNCVAVVRTGDHLWPNASMWVTGDEWTNNYVGVHLQGGLSTGTTPIVEGWKIFVKFIAANYWAGIWLKNSGQYAQISGDHDFNGRRLAIVHLTDATNVSYLGTESGYYLTDGTTQLEYLAYYTYQGDTYIVVASPTDISVDGGTGVIPWDNTKTLSVVGVDGLALGWDTAQVCADNTSKTNFIDILHDFQNTSFAKIQVTAGYLSGIYGGALHSSTLFYQNSFNGITQTIQGQQFSNSGTTLALYNDAISSSPYSNITSSFVNFEKPLYLKDHQVYGAKAFVILPSSDSSTFYDVARMTYTANDKNGSESSQWSFKILTNFDGVYATFDVNLLTTGNVTVSNQTFGSPVFEFRLITTLSSDATSVSGVNLQIRQSAQSTMQFSIVQTRIG